MIKHRKEMDIDELWLCFHWLLKLANLLTNNNWRLQGGIQLDNIFITLKGLPTISIHFLTKIREDDEFLNQKKGYKCNGDKMKNKLLKNNQSSVLVLTPIKEGSNFLVYHFAI